MLVILAEANLERLLKEVAPNAILNAGGRADEVRCYPGTREEVIRRLEKWMDDNNPDRKRIMWLSGPAGAGKSAIFQTVAERCRDRGQDAANFFFFRGDATRNRARPLVATLVYQLRRLYPSLTAPLTRWLKQDPLIFDASIEDQFINLISSPIQAILRLDSSSIHQPIVLIIDGLDECDDKKEQGHVLKALHALANPDHSPFRLLIASRAEPQIIMSFNTLGGSVESMFLDEEYRPQEDIHRFVVAKFDSIKRAHHLAQTLGEGWPAEEDVDAITNKSSGQFIYAATVMRFIEYSSASPALSLITILEMRPSTSHNPFYQLDALYSHIFSRAHDILAVRFIICIHFIPKASVPYPKPPFSMLVQLLGYTTIEVQSLFADLGAIIQVKVENGEPVGLDFYHASLEDYFNNKSRSGAYHVIVEEVSMELSLVLLPKFHDAGTTGIRQVIYT